METRNVKVQKERALRFLILVVLIKMVLLAREKQFVSCPKITGITLPYAYGKQPFCSGP